MNREDYEKSLGLKLIPPPPGMFHSYIWPGPHDVRHIIIVEHNGGTEIFVNVTGPNPIARLLSLREIAAAYEAE